MSVCTVPLVSPPKRTTNALVLALIGLMGSLSIEEIFRRGDDWLVRHRIYGQGGEVLHDTFRPYAKFGR